MRAILDRISGLHSGTEPVTSAEMEKIRASLFALPGTFETNFNVAVGMLGIIGKGWPDDYYQESALRLRTMTPKQAADAFATNIEPSALTWVVMGPLDKIESPIRALNLGEVIVIDADGKKLR